jgi:RNA polymerase sigma-70 factor (ECF subfamily)
VRPEALSALVQTHQAELYRYLRYLGADPHLAEDLLQETFLAAMKSRRVGELVAPEARAAYLRGIARNLWLLACRREYSRPVTVDSRLAERAETVWQTEFLRAGDGFDYVEALRKCLERLEARDRDFLHQHYAERRSRGELARLLEMTENGVKTLARRLRARLGDCIRRRLGAREATP